MRIGLVVDSACDLPAAYFRQHHITLLPVTVHIGEDSLTDMRDEQATLQFLHSHIAERGADAETSPFTVQQIQELFLGRLVIDYDYVFCLTTSKTRARSTRTRPRPVSRSSTSTGRSATPPATTPRSHCA
jgi:fatty acid-binding protein DegV